VFANTSNRKSDEFVSVSDGTVLPMNRRQRVYPNGTLVIEHAQRQADAGTYTCQAQNRQKHTARRDVEVQVIGQSALDYVHVCLNLFVPRQNNFTHNLVMNFSPDITV
jgi:hypothetical protein